MRVFRALAVEVFSPDAIGLPAANSPAAARVATITTARAQSGTDFTVSNTDAFTYNPRNKVTVSTNDQTPANNRAYAYDPIGSRLAATEGQSTAPTKFQTYTSNQLNQYTVIQTTIPAPPKTEKMGVCNGIQCYYEIRKIPAFHRKSVN